MSARLNPRTISDLALIDRLPAVPYTGEVTDMLDELGYRKETLYYSIQNSTVKTRQ